MPKHIVQSFDAELAAVHQRVTAMGAVVVEQLEHLLNAIRSQDAVAAYGVTRREASVNQMEVAADTEIFLLLAKRCPVASDLRFVMAASKVVTHLERTGDEVAKVANVLLEQLQQAGEQDRSGVDGRVLAAGEQTLSHLRSALHVFGALDLPAARQLIQQQEEPHGNLNGYMRQLLGTADQQPAPLAETVSQVLILKSLDRINDLAVEIAEDLVFLAGTD